MNAVHRVVLAFATPWVLSLPTPAHADTGVSAVPYAQVGIVDYALSFDGVLPEPTPGGGFQLVPTSNTFSFTLTQFKAGLAVTYGDFYANVAAAVTTEGSDVQVTSSLESIKWNGENTEYSLALGYNVTEAISVFGGYRDSETSGDGTNNSAYTFTHDGFFLGGSYYVSVTPTGGLTFALGYAWLDATLDERFLGLKLPEGSGDGAGAKIGLSWRDLLSERWGYSVAVDYFDYDYDISAMGIEADMEEKQAVASIGLFYLL